MACEGGEAASCDEEKEGVDWSAYRKARRHAPSKLAGRVDLDLVAALRLPVPRSAGSRGTLPV